MPATGPSAAIDSAVDKVRYLKDLGAHAWDLSGVALAKQQECQGNTQDRKDSPRQTCE
jgi:hypothetical protein